VPAYHVLIEKRAERELRRLPDHIVRRFRGVFERLEEDPYRPRPGCDIRVVQGRPRVKAVRVGEYRGLYEIIEEDKSVWFTKFEHRRSVYG